MRDLARFPRLIEERAGTTPHLTPFRCLSVDGREPPTDITYAALAHHVGRLAAALRARRLRGRTVLLLVEPGLGFIQSLYACFAAGAIAVPVHPPRGKRNLDRIEAIVADVEPALVLTSTAWARDRASIAAPSPLLDAEWLCVDALPLESWSDEDVDVRTRDVAVLQYTSGSTAAPKGVVLTHANIEDNSVRIAQAFGSHGDMRALVWLPPYHDMGLVGGILQPVWAGFAMTLLDPAAFVRRPLRWLEEITACRATVSGGPNFAYEACVSRAAKEKTDGIDLSTWSLAFVGAEPVRPATLRRFTERFAPHGFDRRAFFPCYGLAESTLLVTCPERSVGARTEHVATVGELCTAGRIQPDHDILIVDPATTTALDDGHVGEIWVRGPSVAAGYWKQPDATSAAFDAHLRGAPDGERWLRTGDLGVLIDGELVVTGRLKNVIILNGRKLHSEDVEEAIRASDASLAPGTTVALAHDDGRGERLVVVHELTRGFDAVAFDAVSARMREAVFQTFGVSLEHILFVKPFSLTRTSSGKVIRTRCGEHLRENALDVVFHTESLRRASAAGHV